MNGNQLSLNCDKMDPPVSKLLEEHDSIFYNINSEELDFGDLECEPSSSPKKGQELKAESSEEDFWEMVRKANQLNLPREDIDAEPDIDPEPDINAEPSSPKKRKLEETSPKRNSKRPKQSKNIVSSDDDDDPTRFWKETKERKKLKKLSQSKNTSSCSKDRNANAEKFKVTSSYDKNFNNTRSNVQAQNSSSKEASNSRMNSSLKKQQPISTDTNKSKSTLSKNVGQPHSSSNNQSFNKTSSNVKAPSSSSKEACNGKFNSSLKKQQQPLSNGTTSVASRVNLNKKQEINLEDLVTILSSDEDVIAEKSPASVNKRNINLANFSFKVPSSSSKEASNSKMNSSLKKQQPLSEDTNKSKSTNVEKPQEKNAEASQLLYKLPATQTSILRKKSNFTSYTAAEQKEIEEIGQLSIQFTQIESSQARKNILSQNSDCIEAAESFEDVQITRNESTNSQYVHEKAPGNINTESNNEHPIYIFKKPLFNFMTERKSVREKSLVPAGRFHGLSKKHECFLLRTKGIAGLYDWQKECLSLDAISMRKNLIYALPTSGGKTLVAEILMLREVLLRKQNVIFILPYVSIVQEKIQDLLPFATEFGFLVEEYCSGKGSIPPTKRRDKNSIYICTIEKAQILIDSLYEVDRLREISMVVVDELHMVGDPSRGFVLETILSKIIYSDHLPIQIVGMSATIANLLDMALFMNAHIYTRDFRPVELKEYVKINSEIKWINAKSETVSGVFVPHKSDVGSEFPLARLKRDPDHIGALVEDLYPNKQSCLIFCPTKRNCEDVAILLQETLPETIMDIRRKERINLMKAIRNDMGGRICRTLSKTIPYGIAYHHSGLTNDERKHIEEGFRLGILSVICCTSTLAAGVNLPASRVIIRSPYIGKEFLTLSRYKQMVGRAGRAGKSETGESIVICDPKDFDKLYNMLTAKMDRTISSFIGNKSLYRSLVLNLIGSKHCKNYADFDEFAKCMLARAQESTDGGDVLEEMTEALKDLLSRGIVENDIYKNRGRETMFTYVLDDDKDKIQRNLYPDVELRINRLGRAAVKAGLTLEEAAKIEKDLEIAHRNLVLSQCLHLLYIVAPPDAVREVTLNFMTFNHLFMKMEPSMIHTASVIGISEAAVMRIGRNQSANDRELPVLKRFFVAMILNELWNGKELYVVCEEYKVNRGLVHKLMTSASANAYTIFRFCEVYENYWVFKEILEKFSKRLVYCCSAELLPLMELPNVKLGRAKMMFSAGICSVGDVAKLTPEELVTKLKFINLKQAREVVSAAKYLIQEAITTCKDNYRELMQALNNNNNRKKK